MKKLICLFLLVTVQQGIGENVLRRPMERVASMDPIRAAAAYDAKAVQLVYEPLLDVDYLARPYKLKRGLCELPQVSTDGLEYTFAICKDARFQAPLSRDVTADDVVYSLKRLANKANASSGMWIMDNVAEVTNRVGKIVIRLKTPSHIFPWLMAMAYTAVVPRELVEKFGEEFGSQAVGTGPYKLMNWQRNHRMTFVRDENWRGWKGDMEKRFDRIEYLVIDDASTQWLMFLSGELDFLSAISRDNWDAVVDAQGNLRPELVTRGMKLYSSSAMESMYIGINMNDPVLGKNRALRQALNCAFDFPSWCNFYNNRVIESTGPVPPGIEDRIETPFAYAYNIEKAKQLLAQAGYPDGIDPKTGKRLVITVSVGRASQDAREQAELLAAFYARLGIKLEAKFMTWDAFIKSVNEGRVQLFLLGWVGDYPDAENFMQLFHSKNVSPGANHGSYVNKEYDRVYDAAMKATDPAARAAAWKRAQEIVREDCPWVFLHHPKMYSLIRRRVGNYHPTDFTYGMEKYFTVEDAK